MALKDRLQEDLKDAMRARDPLRVETIRSVRGAVKNKEIELGAELAEDEVQRVIRTLVKQREEAAERFREADRQELADKESQEREILLAYLPAAPDPAAIDATVKAVIDEFGASSPKEMGRVMKEALARLGPAADGKRVSQAAKRLLSGS